MMLSRRRYMGSKKGYNENSYIQDGLVFQLDGFNKGTDVEGQWVDLKGDVTFGNPTSGITQQDNGFLFSGGSNRMELISGTIPNGSTYTVEFVVTFSSKPSSGHNRYFNVKKSGWTDGDIRLYCNTYDWGFFYNQYTRRTTAAQRDALVNRVTPISSTWDTFILNKEIIPMRGESYRTAIGGQRTCVGNSENNYTSGIGVYHAIRIYNRQLSQQEMLFNQDIDIARFGT